MEAPTAPLIARLALCLAAGAFVLNFVAVIVAWRERLSPFEVAGFWALLAWAVTVLACLAWPGALWRWATEWGILRLDERRCTSLHVALAPAMLLGAYLVNPSLVTAGVPAFH